MSSKKYTLTVYAAAPGTPLFDHKTGLPERDEETGKQKTSLPGHMFYAISEDGGRTQTAYGFAPREGAERAAWYSLDMPGAMQKEEHKIYRNPYYARTMEITELQYTALQKFGDKPERYGFNQKTYNLATNSCIDFTFVALKESGIYKGRPIDYHKEGVKIGTVTVYEKAALRVLENIPVLEKMPDQMNSPLNRTVRGQMPDRTLLQWLTTENRQQDLDPEQPQYARIPLTPYAQAAMDNGRACFTKFCDYYNIDYPKDKLDNISAFIAANARSANMRDVSKIDVDGDSVLIGHYQPDLVTAEFSLREAINTPVQESMQQVQTVENRLLQEERERQMAYEQERGRGISMA